MSICRNCSESTIQELGFIGDLAPFFLKRVFHAELRARPSANPNERQLQEKTAGLRDPMYRIHPPVVSVELQICLNCSFIQTRYPFADEAINRLYVDYRSESYNQERIHYEPSYANFADTLGNYTTEDGLERVPSMTAWLQARTDFGDGAMLDFGGADGAYLPNLPGPKLVFEISDVTPVAGVTRIAEEAQLGTYAYVQLAHVLEHATEPLALTKKVAALVQENGFLYVEVPQDLPQELTDHLKTGNVDGVSLTVHEHINYYSPLAISKLLQAAGLKLIAVEAFKVTSVFANQFFIRGLAQRS